MTNYSLRNQTPHELVLLGEAKLLKLAPLQQTRIGGNPAEVLGAAAAAAKRDHGVAWEREPVRSARLLAAELDKTHPGAAASLREGLTETLTVLRLGVPPSWPARCGPPTSSSR